ncbi:unnamed protein product, partial [Nesidiocoris tenuis]
MNEHARHERKCADFRRSRPKSDRLSVARRAYTLEASGSPSGASSTQGAPSGLHAKSVPLDYSSG